MTTIHAVSTILLIETSSPVLRCNKNRLSGGPDLPIGWGTLAFCFTAALDLGPGLQTLINASRLHLLGEHLKEAGSQARLGNKNVRARFDRLAISSEQQGRT